MSDSLVKFNKILGTQYAISSELFEATRSHPSIIKPYESMVKYGCSHVMLSIMGDRILRHIIIHLTSSDEYFKYLHQICVSNILMNMWLEEKNLKQFFKFQEKDNMKPNTKTIMYGNFFESIIASST